MARGGGQYSVDQYSVGQYSAGQKSAGSELVARQSSHATTRSRVLVPGEAAGSALVLDKPLSLWGGLNPETGEIIEQRHPQWRANVSGRVLVMPVGKGSSSSSSILLEAVRQGTAPAAILLAEPDAILALGAAVARELYGEAPPVIALNRDAYDAIRDGEQLELANFQSAAFQPPEA